MSNLVNLNEQAFFSVLSDITRRRILGLLLSEKELSVGELQQALMCAQPMISRHLAVMRESGVLETRRDGVHIHYRLHSRLPAWAQRILELSLDGNTHRVVDLSRLSGVRPTLSAST